MNKAWSMAALLLATPALAQTSGPSQAALDDAVKLGTMAALAPLCGLREERWAFDLRRATILDATHGSKPEDPALRAAPGSQLVVSALSFAEAEALEDFAEAPAEKTCEPLARNPDLARADGIVRAFRTLVEASKPRS